MASLKHALLVKRIKVFALVLDLRLSALRVRLTESFQTVPLA
jgi:hypothetical protein